MRFGIETRSLSIVAAGVLFLLGLSVRAQSQARAAPSGSPSTPKSGTAVPAASYVGSSRCGDCHPAIYARWSKTRMANVVTDPKVHPEVIIPDFSKPDPLLTFTKDDVAFV